MHIAINLKTSRVSIMQTLLLLVLLVSSSSTKLFKPGRMIESRSRLLSPEGKCSVELFNLNHRARESIAHIELKGNWLSSECEIRSHGQFLLRDYHFYETGSFMLRQYHYYDSDCSRPKHAFVAHGKMTHVTNRLWRVPGASEASMRLDEVTVIPYTANAAKQITSNLKKRCFVEPGKPFEWPVLDAYRKLLIYKQYYHLDEEHFGDIAYLDRGYLSQTSTDEIDCTKALNFTVRELELLRMEKEQLEGTDFFVRKLFLGKSLQGELPSHFEVPLKSADESMDCRTCQKIRSANQLTPPLLRSAPKSQSAHVLPVLHLEGDWLSEECESETNGVFARRQMSFDSTSNTFTLRKRYYNDPLCRHSAYSLIARGNFRPGRMLPTLSGSQQITYIIDSVHVIPQSLGVVRRLRHAAKCGPRETWRRGSAIDVAQFGGCDELNISLPIQSIDIIRVRTPPSHKYTANMASIPSGPQLYTGDYGGLLNLHSLPESFRPPMVKCETLTIVVSLVSEDNTQTVNERHMMLTGSVNRVNSLFAMTFIALLSLYSSIRV